MIAFGTTSALIAGAAALLVGTIGYALFRAIRSYRAMREEQDELYRDIWQEAERPAVPERNNEINNL